jgi:hypothetical protein
MPEANQTTPLPGINSWMFAMRYSGIQPQYFPRLHYFARVLSADVFMVRDDVQFVRKHRYPTGEIGKSYQAHSPIKTAQGRVLLSIPIKHEGFTSIANAHIADGLDWISDHLKAIRYAYAKASHFQEIFPEIETLLKHSYNSLAELNLATILWGIWRLIGGEKPPPELSIRTINTQLGLNRHIRLRSIRLGSESMALKRGNGMTANDKIIALMKDVGATEDYCGGTAMAAYMDEAVFARHGITIVVQNWVCTKYMQQFEKEYGFLPNLSIIDLLMNVSSEEALKILHP